MSKKGFLTIILDLIFIIVFNIVFFVSGGFDRPLSVWIAYIFIHLAYIMVLITPLFAKKSSVSAIFNFSLYYVSTIYFVIEFIVGLIFIISVPDSYVASLVVQLILLGLYGGVLIANLLANDTTAENVARDEAEIAYIKSVSSQIKMLMAKTSDKKAQKEIEALYDLVHTSPSRSCGEAKPIEAQMQVKYYELEGAVKSDDTDTILAKTKDFVALVEERNRILSLNN